MVGLAEWMHEEFLYIKRVPRNLPLFEMFYRKSLVKQMGSSNSCFLQTYRNCETVEPVIDVSETRVATPLLRQFEHAAYRKRHAVSQVRNLIHCLDIEDTLVFIPQRLGLKDRLRDRGRKCRDRMRQTG